MNQSLIIYEECVNMSQLELTCINKYACPLFAGSTEIYLLVSNRVDNKQKTTNKPKIMSTYERSTKITLNYNLSSNPNKKFQGKALLRWGNGNGIANIRWNIS